MRHLALSVLALTVLAVGMAHAQPFEAGVHYDPIVPPQPVDEPGQVEVVEVFSYACPHCATFQPFIHGWVEGAPEAVAFRRIPAVFRASWEPFARAYYALEAMDALDRGHEKLFAALHEERRRLRTIEDIADFLAAEADVPKDEFLDVARSFGIETRLRRGMAQARRFGIDATPSVVVNGKYRLTAGKAGSTTEMLAVLDHLVALELPSAGEATPAEGSTEGDGDGPASTP